MKQVIIAAALFATPIFAFGQEAKKPDTVLIPRGVAEAALGWIGEPNPNIAVKLFAALQACIQDNPHNGAVSRMGNDECPEVTAALAAQTKQLADLQKQLAAAQAKPQEPPK